MYERNEKSEARQLAENGGVGVALLLCFFGAMLVGIDACDAREDEREARICRQQCAPVAIRSQNDGDCVCEHGQTPAININTGGGQ